MRVAIVLDMEGAAGIEDYRELYPIYEAYWRVGRQKLTSDVTAAAQGLLDGGATRVLVINHHGAGESGWPNVLVDQLPRGVEYSDLDKTEVRDHADAMFQVGCHARGGSQSFSSHTILPGLRLRLDGELLSESHWWALAAAVPVLGIVGSEALGADLGFLSGVPYLAVQGGEGRVRPRPLFPDETVSARAIRDFAHGAIRNGGAARAFAPRDFVLEASLQNGDAAAPALEAAGWTRTSRTEFRIESNAWRSPGDPVESAIEEAVGATWQPYTAVFANLDAASEASSLAYPQEARAADDAFIESWHAHPMVEWITEESARRWEGLQIGQS